MNAVKPFTIRWTVDKRCDGIMLREFLRNEKHISKKALAQIKFAGGFLFVNGKEVTVRKVLSAGDEVMVVFPPEQPSASVKKENLPLDFVYEDDHFLVVNKSANMPTIPSIDHPDKTLANAVLYYFEKKGIASTFHAVNRLDKDTSGLLLIAKHRYAHDLMAEQQKMGNVNREYIAIVHGRMKGEKGTIDLPIGRKENSLIERTVRSDGQKAVTHFAVLSRHENRTVVKVKLETGRTHQIRVHFAFIGHPLLGDDLYGGKRDEIGRQALHSFRLTFYHPFLEKELAFVKDVPEDMKPLM